MIKRQGMAVRLAAAGDLHCAKKTKEELRALFAAMAAHADILVLAGDLCDTGLPDEARMLAHELAAVRVPAVAVLGNHDFESGKAAEVVSILTDAGVNVLDGKACEILGLGFAGTKGFAGGFGDKALQPWGEEAIKRFVHEAVEEALKLESALAALRTEKKVALLHYSPIIETVVGEPPEIMPFLGSSRLEDPLNRYPVELVFHGHAHNGTLEGKTTAGVPVYNVAIPLLQKKLPGAPPFRLVEIDLARPREPAP
ncbi:MAG TPA: metallophosphoesterase [Candidatus Acidoferrales bacterium]|nr:metallophosphoesterase [Candidatus Acidoferrales bacterium]